MPRKICEICYKGKIVYRVYTVCGPKREVCERCARSLLDSGNVFNLRRILSIALGTKEPEEDAAVDL